MGTSSNYVMPAAITTASNYAKPQFSNYVTAPAATTYVQPTSIAVQPAANSYYVQPQAEFSNYVMGTTAAAPVATYVQPAANSYYVQPQAATTSVFDAIDTNHDGRISRSEFANFIGQPLATTYAPSPVLQYY